MIKVKYKTLKIKNFLSVGNDMVEIDYKCGLNHIEGKNIDEPDRKNACGKSVTINAHFFALFGETIDKIKGEFIPNNITNGKGFVELSIEVMDDDKSKSYTIKRHVKPSKVELWCEGVDITLDSIANTNKYINNLLQTNSTIYKCCDVMTIRDTIPFMSMKSEDKRKFIEDIFSINVFGLMVKDLKKNITDTKNNTNISAAKHTEITNSLTTLLEQKEVLIKQNQDRSIILQKRKDDVEESIRNTEEKISNIIIIDNQPILDEQIKLNDAWAKIDGIIASYITKISDLKSTKSLYEADIKKSSEISGGVQCSKCLQDIPHTHVKQLENSLIETKAQLALCIDEIEKYDDKRTTINNKKTKIQSKLKDLSDVLSQDKLNRLELQSNTLTLKQYRHIQNELLVDIEDSSTSLDAFEDNIKSTEIRKEEESNILSIYQQHLSDLDICKFILSEEGVKSFVIKKLLTMLNNTIDEYLIKMGLSVRCKFDEYFDEVITNNKGKIFSYKNASGAEKKSLDFACALSFSDMRKKINGIYSNLEFFDEFLDSAVDSVGLVTMLDILKERSDENDGSVYIISHRKEVIPHITGETIMLEKSGGLTRRI